MIRSKTRSQKLFGLTYQFLLVRACASREAPVAFSKFDMLTPRYLYSGFIVIDGSGLRQRARGLGQKVLHPFG